MHPIRHLLLPLIAACIWGTAFVAQEIAAEALDTFAFNMARDWIAFVFLLILAIGYDLISKKVQEKKGTFVPLSPQEKKDRTKNTMISGLVCGTTLAIAAALQQQGIELSGAGKAGFLTALYVVLIPIFGLALKQKAPRRVWVAAVLAVVGLYFLCIQPGTSLRIQGGDWFLIACAACFSIQILCINHFGQKVNGLKLSCLQFLVAGVIMSVCTMLFSKGVSFSAIFMSKPLLLSVLYAGVMSSGVAYTLQIIAQKGANPTVISLIMSLESVFATVASAVLLHEVLTGREYLGCVFMFCAVLLSQIPIGALIKNLQKKGKIV